MKKTNSFRFLLVCILFTLGVPATAQDPARFHDEVQKLVSGDTVVDRKNLILFAGSSSVRLWKTLKSDFPKHNVLNRGFGGSVMTDLIYYVDTLIISYQPKKVFIYEGDNDIGGGQAPDSVMAEAIRLTRLIKDKLPKTEVLFISPKPSLLRWNDKEDYELYNSKLKSWCSTQKGVSFIDVWTPMLNANSGKVRDDLFEEDGLHMNETGYAIWKKVIEPHLKK